MNPKLTLITSDIIAALTMLSMIPYDKDTLQLVNAVVPPSWIPWVIKAGIASTVVLRLISRYTTKTEPKTP